MPSDNQPAPAPTQASSQSWLKPLVFLLVGAVLGVGGSFAYATFVPRPVPETRTVLARFLMQAPVGTCKQVMVLGFRASGFQDVRPDAGEDVGVGARGDRISGGALCMPALGAATVAMSSADPALLAARMQAFAAAVAATNFAPQPPPPQRR
jgi:hypothetical protein